MGVQISILSKQLHINVIILGDQFHEFGQHTGRPLLHYIAGVMVEVFNRDGFVVVVGEE